MRSYQRSVCLDSPHFSAASLMLQVVTFTSLRVRVRSNANGGRDPMVRSAEVVALVQVLDQTGLDRPPAEQLGGERA